MVDLIDRKAIVYGPCNNHDIECKCTDCETCLHAVVSREDINKIPRIDPLKNIFAEYEKLIEELSEGINNGSIDGMEASESVDKFCIETLRGVLADHYSDKLIKFGGNK